MELAADDKGRILDLLRTMADAWARGDGAGYAEVFAEDARYVTMSGLRIVGRRAIGDSHQELFDSVFRGTRLGLDDVECQPVAPDVVLVHGSGMLLAANGNEPGPRPAGLLTMVAVNDGGAWRFASFSNTPVRQQAA